MDNDIQNLEERAQNLPPRERAQLIRRLIATLDVDDDADAEQLWLDEADRRLAAHQRGETNAIPGDEVFGRLLKPDK